MFNSPMLEVALGLVVAFLLLSLVCSMVVEYLLEASRTRGRLLRDHIVKLLGEPAALLFYADPQVLALASGTPPPIDPLSKLAFEALGTRAEASKAGVQAKKAAQTLRNLLGWARPPSCIPDTVFADVVLGWLRDPESGQLRAPSSASIGTATVPLPGDLIDAWDGLYQRAGGEEAALRDALRHWFTHSTDRLVGHFRRRARIALFYSGLVLTLLIGADTLAMVNRLYADEGLRGAMGDTASALQAACPDGLRACELTGEGSEELQTKIRDGFGIAAHDLFAGPGQFGDGLQKVVEADGLASLTALLTLLAGYLMTVLAITLGADFWFGVLQRILRIQSARNQAADLDPKPGTGEAQDAAVTPATSPSRPAEPAPTLDDPRVDTLPLLREIQFTESRMAAWCLGQLSDLAYLSESELEAHSGARRLNFKSRVFLPAKGGEAWCFEWEHACVVAFRGTEKKLDDILADLKFALEPLAGNPACLVHEGFKTRLDEVWPALSAWLSTRKQPVFFTGHSLGGAMAVLAAYRWARPAAWVSHPQTANAPAAAPVVSTASVRSPIAGVYTYGQPRVGNESFANAYREALGSRTFRYVNHCDIVPTLPPVIPLHPLRAPAPVAPDLRASTQAPGPAGVVAPETEPRREEASAISGHRASELPPLALASDANSCTSAADSKAHDLVPAPLAPLVPNVAPESVAGASFVASADTTPNALPEKSYLVSDSNTNLKYSHVGASRYFDSIGEFHTHYAGWLRLVDRFLLPVVTPMLVTKSADFRQAALDAGKQHIQNHYMQAYLQRLGQIPEVRRAWKEAS